MKHRIQTIIATLALILTAAASPTLCAQAAATPPPAIEIQGLYDAGRLQLARERCQQVLSADPANVVVRHLAEKIARAMGGANSDAGKGTLIVPSITVESGKQAVIQIDGNQYTVTPTILDGRRVELQTSIAEIAGDESLVSLDAVAATDIKVLMERIERTICLRAFEKVVNEIFQAELEFSDEPALGEEATKHVKRVEQQNAKLVRLQELRERLRREMLEEGREKPARK